MTKKDYVRFAAYIKAMHDTAGLIGKLRTPAQQKQRTELAREVAQACAAVFREDRAATNARPRKSAKKRYEFDSEPFFKLCGLD